MNDEQIYLEKLSLRDIKPTAMRVLILRTMMSEQRAVSLLDLTDLLVTVDKSTISRTLALFLSHHLIHSIDDGSGALKYAVCSNECSCDVDDLHTHFYCTKCHRTLCLRGLPVPIVHLPEGFALESVNYVLKGLCPECSRHQSFGLRSK